MRIRHISVRNFRGIRELDWSIPDQSVVCLIGRGDSTKSTILEAIRRVFHPHWNLAFDDSDFFECSPKNKLRIDALLGDLPNEFRDLEGYAQRMCGWNSKTSLVEDDPGDGLEDVLRIRLEVGDDLEPSWKVVKGDTDEGQIFRASDRSKVSVSLIGGAFDRDLTWSRGSLLSRLTKGESIPALLADAARAARLSIEQQRDEGLVKFDAVAKTAETAAKELGVRVNSKYAANLDSDGMNIRLGGLAIHDGAVPLRQLGLGSKRVLTTGLHRHGIDLPHVTLIDEIEHGLEPHRIARLIDHIKSDKNGQYFATTHSPVALREFGVADLHIVHAKSGKTQVVLAAQPNVADSIQGKIRLHAEGFLAPRVIVCEGATEVGFLRGFDAYWTDKGNRPFAYQGIALMDAKSGSKVRALAEELQLLSYAVAVFADADAPKQFGPKDMAHLDGKGIPVTVWSDDMCLEQRVFADVPWSAVVASIELAVELLGSRLVVDNVRSQKGANTFDSDHTKWTDSPELRKALGGAAKASDWFKTVSKGQAWATRVCGACNPEHFAAKDLGTKLEQLRKWIDLA